MTIRPPRGLPVRASPPFGGLLKATAYGRGWLLPAGLRESTTRGDIRIEQCPAAFGVHKMQRLGGFRRVARTGSSTSRRERIDRVPALGAMRRPPWEARRVRGAGGVAAPAPSPLVESPGICLTRAGTPRYSQIPGTATRPHRQRRP